MQAVTAEIVVFSDANTFLEPDAVRALVRNFADDRSAGQRRRRAGRRPRAAGTLRGPLLPLRALDPASRVGDRLDDRRRRRAVRHPPRAVRRRRRADTILDDMAIPMAVVRAGVGWCSSPTRARYEQGVGDGEGGVRAQDARHRRRHAVPGAARQRGAAGERRRSSCRWSRTRRCGGCRRRFGRVRSSASIAARRCVPLATQLPLRRKGCCSCSGRRRLLRRPLRRSAVVALAHYFCLVQAAAAVGFVRGLSGRQSVSVAAVRTRARAAAPIGGS